MTWDIRYSRDGEDHLESYPDAETAIEAACVLIDQDCDVHGIWTGDLAEAVGPAQIMRVYSVRSRSLAKP
jgi:hypothetical protein